MKFQRDHLLVQDWFDSPVEPPLTTSLSAEGNQFIFTAQQALPCLPHPDAEQGVFRPELWKFDVVEVFFCEPKTGAYLEINLAPSGGWWACWFDHVRVARAVQPDFSKISARGEVTGAGWEASITIPLSLFEQPESLHYNITAIIDSPQQRFLTAFPLGCQEPDFHRPSHFQPLFAPDPS